MRIDAEAIVLLFGTVDTHEKRKGFNYITEAMKKLEAANVAVQLVVFGNPGNGPLPGIAYPVQFLGLIESDENLVAAYNAADVFLAPYLEDNLPNTVIEAIACGLPIVGFDSGGMADLVEHKINGYLATAYDSSDLAAGINWVIRNLNQLPFAESSRHKSLNFSLTSQVERIEKMLT